MFLFCRMCQKQFCHKKPGAEKRASRHAPRRAKTELALNQSSSEHAASMSFASDMQSLKESANDRRNGIFVIKEEVMSRMTTEESAYQLQFLLKQRFHESMIHFVTTLDRGVLPGAGDAHHADRRSGDLEMGQIAKDIATSVSEAMFGMEGEVLEQLRRLQNEHLPARIFALKRELGRLEDALNAIKRLCAASGTDFYETYFETEPYIQLLAERTPPQLEALLERSHTRIADLSTTFSRHKISDSYNKDKLERAEDVSKWLRLRRRDLGRRGHGFEHNQAHRGLGVQRALLFWSQVVDPLTDRQLDMTSLLSVRGALVPLPMPRHLDAESRNFVVVAEADSGYCCRRARLLCAHTDGSARAPAGKHYWRALPEHAHF